MEPELKRMETSRFIVRDEVIYRLYIVRLTFSDGRTKDFPSEEHAKAWLEDREPEFIPFKTA